MALPSLTDSLQKCADKVQLRIGALDFELAQQRAKYQDFQADVVQLKAFLAIKEKAMRQMKKDYKPKLKLSRKLKANKEQLEEKILVLKRKARQKREV